MPRTCNYMRPKRVASAGVATGRPDVAVSHEYYAEGDPSVFQLDGGLRVVVERNWQPEVPCEQTFEAPLIFAVESNPHNQCGAVFAEQVPVVTGSDLASLYAAFNKRCNARHKDNIDDDMYDKSVKLIGAITTKFDAWNENELDRARWESKFDSSKVQRMRDAVHTLNTVDYKYLGTKDLSIKREVLLKRNDPSFAARVIYAGNDAFNAVTGPAMMIAMERLETILNREDFGPVRYCTAYKKHDVQLASFIASHRGDYPHVVEGDYSANDRHQRKGVHELFNLFLERVGMPSWVTYMFSKMNSFKVQSRQYGLTAKLKNQLPTGTTATTVRNTLYNALMFSVSCGLQGLRGRALILGDDLLGRVSAPMDLNWWTQTVADFRMVLKAKSPKLNGGATFLSKRLLVDREEPCMVPMVGKALARFNARAIYDNRKTHSQYMAGKSLSYAYEFRHIPFMRDFFLLRYTMEDNSRLELEELSWNVKVSGINLRNIVQAIKDEKVIVSDDEFLDWAMETYDLGLVDLEEVFELIVLNTEPEMVYHSSVASLSIDW